MIRIQHYHPMTGLLQDWVASSLEAALLRIQFLDIIYNVQYGRRPSAYCISSSSNHTL